MSFFLLSYTTVALFATQIFAFTSSQYSLTHEYSGLNFFDGWDFFTGRDPTGGFVTYYSRSSAQLEGLIASAEGTAAYMGVNSKDKLLLNAETGSGDGAGRPSVRIATKQAFTHGLFIGDFEHIPAGVCGTWPAFWTLGPNWPYTGEIDIMEGVNLNTNNAMSLHTNETCIITGDSSVMTGTLENTNCAYYPDDNVGCGVQDTRSTSYGSGFNEAGGGVYAMQWTSESILIWYWPRAGVPANVDDKTPDPSSWGLPAAQLAVGNCSVDQHFQSHKIVFDNTFCGAYAGYPSVWNSNINSCAASTGLSTCDAFVAEHPEAFKEAYWSVNYVRVYQLVDPETTLSSPSYIASEQPLNTVSNAYTALPPVATPNLDVDSLCPKYNYSIISDGKYQYEIACDVDPPGPDIVGQPYSGFQANSMADCIRGCTYMNENNGTNKCGGVSHFAAINFCYFKKYIDGQPTYRPGYNEIRLIFYGYPQITDDPRSLADSTLTSSFIETIPIPQTYRPSTTTSTRSITTSTSTLSSEQPPPTAASGGFPPAMGNNITSTTSSLRSDYSETVIKSQENSTSTKTSTSSSNPSTDPSVSSQSFYILFQVSELTKRLVRRDIEYLAFDINGQSILVSSEAQAAKFKLGPRQSLMSGSQYVAIDTTVRPTRFILQNSEPNPPVTVTVDNTGSVVVPGVQGYCLTSDASLAILTPDEDRPDDCTVIKPELVVASTTTTTPGSISLSITQSSSASLSTTQSSYTTTSSGLTTSASSSPTASVINGFIYAGCFGIADLQAAASIPGISLPLTDALMTNDKCTAECVKLNAYYAGTHEQSCFCGTDTSVYASLLKEPDALCTMPCAGASNETCGGTISFQVAVPTTTSTSSTVGKRQANLVLISLYNSTLLLPQPDQSGVSSSSTKTSSQSNSLTNDGGVSITDTLTSTVTVIPIVTNDPTSFSPDQVSYNITGTNTVTVISTTYVDVCETGLTIQATTITVPHCGCTASYDSQLQTIVQVTSPSVPMTTQVKQCACGLDGAQSTITVTVPHTASIEQLAAMITSYSGPGDAILSLGSSPLNGESQPHVLVPSATNTGLPKPAEDYASPLPYVASNGFLATATLTTPTSSDIQRTGVEGIVQSASNPVSTPDGQSLVPSNTTVTLSSGLLNNGTYRGPIQSYSISSGSRLQILGNVFGLDGRYSLSLFAMALLGLFLGVR